MQIPDVRRNEVRVHECPRWDAFVATVRKEWPLPAEEGSVITADKVIFRGHSDQSWKLWSKLERSLVMYATGQDGATQILAAREAKGLEWYDRYCNEILEKFRRFSHGMPGAYPRMPDDELWALGRHHGLLTPLLDWTESPYVAAYFAFDKHRGEYERGSKVLRVPPEGPGVSVWGLRFWEDLHAPQEFDVIDVVPTTAVRQRAQRGLFTRLRSEKHQDIERYLRSRGLAHCLEVYQIPSAAAIDALRDFDLMNLTPATLFPDLNGAAEQANFDMASLRFSAFSHEFPLGE